MFNIFKSSKSANNLSQIEWSTQLANDSNAIILDVRTAQECSQGKIPKAKNINFLSPRFNKEVSKLDKTKTYYIYCRSGNRSGKACSIMKGLGFEKTYNLVGGMSQWKGKRV